MMLAINPTMYTQKLFSLVESKESEVVQSCQTLCDPMDACTKLLRPWDFQGKSTGVGCHFLLQGIFPTQGSNPGLSHCRQTLYHLSHQDGIVTLIINAKHSTLLGCLFLAPSTLPGTRDVLRKTLLDS